MYEELGDLNKARLEIASNHMDLGETAILIEAFHLWLDKYRNLLNYSNSWKEFNKKH